LEDLRNDFHQRLIADQLDYAKRVRETAPLTWMTAFRWTFFLIFLVLVDVAVGILLGNIAYSAWLIIN
jgi:hypothetical protein